MLRGMLGGMVETPRERLMVRRSAVVVVLLTLAMGVVGDLQPSVAGINPSLCLTADQGCLAPGDIQVKVILGAADAVILGGQFTLVYDPNRFSLTDAAPGSACDPTSPFALEILVDDDRSLGEVRCAFGVDFKEGLPPAEESTTLACLSFTPIGDAAIPASVCLLQGQNPFETVLVDGRGYAVPVDNSQACPPNSPPPILACVDTVLGVDCICTPDSADCHALDTPCRIGVCNPLTSNCEIVFVNEGGPCDDGDPCTLVDRCSAGTCVGAGCSNSLLCVGSDSCPALVQPLTVESDVEYQGPTPVQTLKNRSTDDDLPKQSILP